MTPLAGLQTLHARAEAGLGGCDGLAMYLLEAADSKVGVSCLGGEAFGEDGYGYIRMSCAESADRLRVAAEFLEMHLKDSARVKKFVADNPPYRAMRL